MAWHERDYYREPSGGGGFGGFGRGGGGFGSPFSGGKLSVTMWLLIINVVVFLIDGIMAAGQRTAQPFLTMIGNFNVQQGVFGFQLWRVVTYQFLHAGIFHILVNMIVLYFFGPLMESWWGSRRYLAFYLLCGISGAFLMTILAPILPLISTADRLVGASGAIFGLLVGGAVLFPNQRVMLLIPPIPMSLRTLALVLLGITALQMLVGANTGGNAAHLGGAALGFLLVRRPQWLDWADTLPSRGPSSPTHKIKRKLEEAHKAQKQREEQEVDRILDKVKEHGLQSLTRSEKKVLNRATERHNQRR